MRSLRLRLYFREVQDVQGHNAQADLGFIGIEPIKQMSVGKGMLV